MVDPVERLVNLALFLASVSIPVSAETVRTEVEGYPDSQDADAFLRMFERDKDQLRDAGFAIEESGGCYRMDTTSTFATDVEFSPEEAAAIRAVGQALLEDPAFPFADDLRLALAKIATSFSPPGTSAITRLASEQPERQGDLVAALDIAVTGRKRVTFGYTNQHGEHKDHEVEPYGLFAHDGRWYLVARDAAIGEVRVYAVARIDSAAANPSRPKSADFERPASFDVGSFISLPFQYGAEAFRVRLRFSAEHAWRAPALTTGKGNLEDDGDALVWSVTARSAEALIRWVVENGPGISILEPDTLASELSLRAREVAALHG